MGQIGQAGYGIRYSGSTGGSAVDRLELPAQALQRHAQGGHQLGGTVHRLASPERFESGTQLPDLVAADPPAVTLEGVGAVAQRERIAAPGRVAQRIQTVRRFGLEPLDNGRDEIGSVWPLQPSDLGEPRRIEAPPKRSMSTWSPNVRWRSTCCSTSRSSSRSSSPVWASYAARSAGPLVTALVGTCTRTMPG